LEAIKKGFVSNIDELKSICRLLWLKSVNSEAEKKFETIFDRYFQENKKCAISVNTFPVSTTKF
ncbi:MAG: hypothetical protein AB4038_10700, partial [Prochloraceae cyanobacterium]